MNNNNRPNFRGQIKNEKLDHHFYIRQYGSPLQMYKLVQKWDKLDLIGYKMCYNENNIIKDHIFKSSKS